MPASGGSADKLGNRYEALWAIDQLLRIVDGAATDFLLEPLNPDDSLGIEFRVSNTDRTVEYWSVKRQTTRAAGWTLSTLAAKDNRGRSILSDLLGHVQQNTAHRSVFASMLAAPDFDELRTYAADQKMLDERLARSKDLTAGYQSFLLPICGGDHDKVRAFLLATRTYAIDETQLRDSVEFKVRKLFYRVGGGLADPAAVRGYLCDLLHENIHRPICIDAILDCLASHGIRRSDWAIDKSVTDQITAICETYCESLHSQLVNRKFIEIPGSTSILGPGGLPAATKVLLIGDAGGGKSCSLAITVTSLRSDGVPVLPIRFDLLPEGILSTTELGHKLLLPESPTLVLSAVAKGKPCILAVDQLDAVSIASGRRTELWNLFDSLRREAEKIPNLYLLVGCRAFDLEHDHRMRALKAPGSGFAPVELKPLRSEQVDAALREAGVMPESLMPGLKPILTVPLHLSMFLSLPASVYPSIRGRDELFDQFWLDKERKTGLRLGRPAAWTAVIDTLSNWLSSHQQLSAPEMILDAYTSDASAMASEYVLVRADGRFRFFHESFFDYAFARRFAASGRLLIDLLLPNEQHLFRRAQVRQVLAYLRAQDRPCYLQELASILTTDAVRFHIKSLILQWMSALPDPRPEEWAVLKTLFLAKPEFRSHVLGVVRANEDWFDVLDGIGFFRDALSSSDVTREQEAVWLLSMPNTMAKRSARVATLLKDARKLSDAWNQYLRYICRQGDVYHSREMFDLFLSLIDDGTLDGLKPGFAVNDDWWCMLYSMGEKYPDLACEAIGHWLDHELATWAQANNNSVDTEEGPKSNLLLDQHLDRSGYGTQVVLAATKAPLSFVEQMLPRIARFINETANDCGDRLQIDPLFSFRIFGDNPMQVHSALLCGLAHSLEALARTDSTGLNRLIAPFKDRPHDAIVYLVLRAWTAAPDTYANTLADFLVADPRRLKVGYASWGGDGGSAANHTSSQAVKAASSLCTPERLAALVTAIINLSDDWESNNPRFRGRRQLELLESVDAERLGAAGRAKLLELQAKFPTVNRTEPMAIGFSCVGSPVPEDAQAKMSDENWLGAMRKYAGVGSCNDRSFEFSGGEYQLAQALEGRTKADPVRFAALVERMEDDLPESYFSAILRGVADCISNAKDSAPLVISFAQVILLLRRVGRLPNRPCGRPLAYLVEKWKAQDWPDDILDLIGWHAINDPDPDMELWRTLAESGQFYYGGDPLIAGINSARGSMASAISRLLFEKPTRFARLKDAVYSLSHDRSVAVRMCAIETLLPLLNFDSATAIEWFKECLALDPVLYSGRLVEHFLRYAVERDYAGVRSVLEVMLGSSSEKALAASARLICIAALDDDVAKPDAERIHNGTPLFRKAAADVYSTHIAHKVVGAACRTLLKPFFSDTDESVRTEAASAFHHIAEMSTEMLMDLLAAFLEAKPGAKALEQVVRALEDSPVQLPDLVCRLAGQCIDAFKDEAGDISKAGAAAAMGLSKIVIRLYTQTAEPAIQSRCLTMIDMMERYHFLGLSQELQRLDR